MNADEANSEFLWLGLIVKSEGNHTKCAHIDEIARWVS
jgi:hypothetical protein